MAIAHIGNNIYLLLSTDTKPTNVPTGSISITTNTRRIYLWDGDSWEEVAYTTPGGADERTIVKEGGTAVGTAVGRPLNFAVTSDFTIAEDAGNDEYDIQIADNAITDALISAHTTTKITSPKSLLPAAIAYEDESNTFTAGNVFTQENVFQVQQKHNRIATTPADPDVDTGLTYLLTLDANNDVFARKSKIGGQFVQTRDF
jgi:hypothetical protein